MNWLTSTRIGTMLGMGVELELDWSVMLQTTASLEFDLCDLFDVWTPPVQVRGVIESF